MSGRASLGSPLIPAVLSLIWPGLGLVAAGRVRRGVLEALPQILLLAAALGLVLFDRGVLRDSILSPDALLLFLLIDVAWLVYRLWSIVDTYLVVAGPDGVQPAGTQPAGGLRWPAAAGGIGHRAGAALIALLVVGALPNLALGAIDVNANDTWNCVFNPDAPCWFGSGNLPANETAPPVADETAGPLDSSPDTTTPEITDSPSPAASPTANGSGTPTPRVTLGPTTAAGIPIFPIENASGPNTPPAQWRDDGYLDLLLIGVDQGAGRWSLRPDTMILLRVEIATGKAVMFGVPRNLENVPLPPEAANAFPCHCFPYPNLLNGLWRDAVNRPKAYPYPGSDFARGFSALEGAIGQYLGVHVDGSVVINLMGFVNLINALGGLDICVPKELKDYHYSRPQDGRDVYLDIKAGCQHMNGYTALAYARSRHQDSDYGRMVRQQAVLMALRAQLNPCELLPKVNDLISALGSAFWTDMPREDAAALAALAQKVGTANVKNVELVPSVTGNPVGFLNIPRWMTVRNIVAHGLDGVPASSSGSSGGGGVGLSC